MYGVALTAQLPASVLSIGPFEDAEQLAVFAAALALLLAGLVVLYFSFRQFARAARIATNRPVPAGEVEAGDGTVEIQGTAEELDGTLTGTYSNATTFAYEYKRKKKEVERDQDGNREVEWRTVASGENSTPFVVADESGSVAVDPADATLSVDVNRQTGGGRGYRNYEGNIKPDDTVHVWGQTLEADGGEDLPDDVEFYVGDGDGRDFLVSDTTQFRTVLRYVLSGLVRLFIALVVFGFGVLAGVVTLDEVFGMGPMA